MRGGKVSDGAWPAFQLVEQMGFALTCESLTGEADGVAFHSPLCSTAPPALRQMGAK